jgi:hypothetical protein
MTITRNINPIRMVLDEYITRCSSELGAKEKFQTANAKSAARRVLRAAQLQAVANWLKNQATGRLDELESDLATLVMDKGIGGDLSKLFKRASELIKAAFGDIAAEMGGHLHRVSKASARKAVDAAEQHHSEPVGHGPIKEPSVMGATLAEHFQKLTNDFDFKFRMAVRQGKLAGDSLEHIIERFTGPVTSAVTASEVVRADKEEDAPSKPRGKVEVRIADASESALDKLLSAAVHAFSHEGETAVDTSESEKEMGWEWVGILDDRICERCEFYAGNRWTKEYEPVGDGPEFPEDPPLHINCRCAVVLVNLAEEGAPDANFDDYLAQFSRTEQEQAFGKAALRAYHRGDITAGQLVAQQSHALSIDDFEKAAA